MKNWFFSSVLFSFVLILVACKSGDNPIPDPQAGKEVIGSVKDGNGGAYPNTTVVLFNSSKSLKATTNAQGNFSFDVEDSGSYQVRIEPPLASEVVSEDSVSIQVMTDQVVTVNFIIQTHALEALVVIEEIDIFKEIKNAAGVSPTSPSEEIFATNAFDPPFNVLTPITAPDAHQLILSEWAAAQGEAKARCEGTSAMADITLQGMIPNGTYTLWCNFLNKRKLPGESVNIGSDVAQIQPLGSGTTNVVIADATGKINTTIQHPTCLLTKSAALVLVVDYHINGNTFGTAHIPDEEDVNQLLFYFL